MQKVAISHEKRKNATFWVMMRRIDSVLKESQSVKACRANAEGSVVARFSFLSFPG